MAQPEYLPEREASRDLTQLRGALAFLRPYGWQIFAASVALVVTASITLSVGQGVRIVIDSGFGSQDAELLSASLLLFAALVLALTIGTFVRFFFVSWIGERVSADIRTAVYAHLVDLHPGFFEENLPTEIQSRITTDTTLLQTVIGSSVSIALRNVLMFFGGVVLLFVTNPRLSLIVLGSIPLVVAPILLFGRRVRALSRSSQDTLANVGSYAGESLRNIKLVQAFNHQGTDRRRFEHRVEQAFGVAVRRIRQRALLIALVMLLVMSAIAVMLWVGGQDVLVGRTSAGELAAFVFYAFIVAGSVGAISEVLSDLQRAAGATERLLELLNAENLLTDPPTTVPEPATVLEAPGREAAAVAFENVHFAYPTRPTVQVLKDLSFDIAAGEFVALVGPSGAGKSTVLDLMLRFYDPQTGAVRLNGVNLRDLPRADLRGAIAMVPQDAALLAGTLLELVCYADGDQPPDLARARLALERANAWSFVAALPDGLDTRLGEGGTGLSGGQRQRLAIARALYSEPALLLLDEATSALDADSEDQVRAAVQNIRGTCTVIAIAHRLSTVTGADRILVLENGQIVASGPHERLLRESALYARYAEVQFGAERSGTNGASSAS